MMDSTKLWRTLKSSPAYGRLTTPTGPSHLLKNSASNSTHGNQINLQYPSELLRAKALEYKVSAEKLRNKWDEKYNLLKSHFPSQSKEWQHWYLEATVWGGLCRFTFEMLQECADLA
jgi:hypothetical protein